MSLLDVIGGRKRRRPRRNPYAQLALQQDYDPADPTGVQKRERAHLANAWSGAVTAGTRTRSSAPASVAATPGSASSGLPVAPYPPYVTPTPSPEPPYVAPIPDPAPLPVPQPAPAPVPEPVTPPMPAAPGNSGTHRNPQASGGGGGGPARCKKHDPGCMIANAQTGRAGATAALDDRMPAGADRFVLAQGARYDRRPR
jgi:hypothetical protein